MEDKAWLLSERDKFEHELDSNGDGVLDLGEVQKWVIPDNDEIAEEEVEHLFQSADEDHDGRLSYAEILDNHHVFVGNEADNSILGEHFDDEL
ncbi:hypothetical protein evm_014944 [Chilo suppressalis]|nr:hypothetical protein evm_014944 [Chilo suppressalis]